MDKTLEWGLKQIAKHFPQDEKYLRVYPVPEKSAMTVEEFDKLRERIERLEREVYGLAECGCPATLHDCDNCSSCGTASEFTADDERDFEMQHGD